MNARLINVRLDAERLRKVRRLRENGVALSDLVRQAIDERFESLSKPARSSAVKAIIAGIFEQYPDPPDLPPRTYDVHERKAARAAIVRKVRQGRR
jgi:hypothetical protein